MVKRERAPKHTGVYYREHSERRHNGKPDRCFDITYKTPQGKKEWEKVGWASEGYTVQMAAQMRAERIRTMRHGEELPKRKKAEPTFGEAWDAYEEWATVNRKSFVAETNRYHKHLKSSLASVPLSQVNSFQLEKIKSDLLKADYSKQTVKHVLVLVRQIINKAISLGLWEGNNPVKGINLPRPNNRRERFLSVEEAGLLLGDLEKVSMDLHDMAFLSLHTGMRAGEIFNLAWGHVNLGEGFITILDSKAGQAQKVFINESVKQVLLNRMAELPSDSAADLVFQSRNGSKIKEVSDAFTRAVERLGFNKGIEDRRQRVCFHTLRHTFASWLALEGTPILTIKELLRHSTLAMTERYAHLIPDHKRQAVSLLDSRLNGRLKNIGAESNQ